VAFCGENNGTPLCYVPDYEQALQFLSSEAKQSPSRKEEIASSQKTLLAMTQAEQQLQLQIAHHYFEEDSGVTRLPVQGETLAVGDAELTWNYVRCGDDHFVDLSGFYPTCHYLRAWTYAQVVSPASQEVTFILTTNGPADLWLNGQHIHRQEHFHPQIPGSISFPAPLREGHNEILVRFEEVAVRECPYAMALQIVQPSLAKVADMLADVCSFAHQARFQVNSPSNLRKAE